MLTRSEKLEALAIEQELLYRRAERSLAEFTRQSWSILEPATVLKWGWHLDYAAEHLEAVARGEILQLIINIPPRNLKSILVSISFPPWVWTSMPSTRFLCGSYSQSLASKHSIDCRTVIESDWYQRKWKLKVKLVDDQNQKMEFVNTRRGHRIATSILGTATGKGGDIVIADDPHDTTGALSDVERKTTIETFRQKFMSRHDDKKTGRTIVVMQRLHESDLTGELLKDGGWTHVNLPAIAPKKTIIVFPTSKREVVREAGTALHPAREDLATLSQIKKNLGSRAFAGQYDQAPAAAEGNIIKREWIRFWDSHPTFEEEIISVDATFTGKATSDFVAMQVWGRNGARKYLLDQIYGRMGLTDTISALVSLCEKWPGAKTKIIENKANGPAIEDLLSRHISGIVLVEPQGDKIARVNAVSPQLEAGNVLFPMTSREPWVESLIDELVTFPNAAHDDRVDAMSQALLRLEESCSRGVGTIRILR